MKRAITILIVAALAAGLACKKGSDQESAGALFASPEATFETTKKGLVNRDADLLWDAISSRLIGIFEEGRKEVLAKPLDEKKTIAVEGMTTVEELEKMDTKGFFRFYFNYKKREVYRMNTAELLDRKVDAIRKAAIKKVTYVPADKAQAKKAYVTYEMSGQEFIMPMVLEKGKWLVDSMEEPQSIPANGGE